MCFLCPIIFGQQTNIEGLGDFKLNTTQLKFVKAYAQEKSISIKKFTKADDLNKYKETNEIYIIEIIPDTLAPMSAIKSANFCPKTRVFLFAEYVIAGFKIKGLTLTFYNDVLIGLYSDITTDLRDALIRKYGEPQVEVSKIKTRCPNDGIITHQSWENGTIIAVVYTEKRYDSYCKATTYALLTIFDASKSSRLDRCNEKYKNIYVQKSLQDL